MPKATSQLLLWSDWTHKFFKRVGLCVHFNDVRVPAHRDSRDEADGDCCNQKNKTVSCFNDFCFYSSADAMISFS